MANPRPCSVEGCERLTGVPGTARGWCHSHYRRWRIYGDPLGEHEWMPKTCTIDGCDKPTQSRGWCSMHWSRWYRHGDPLARQPGEIVNGCRICPTCGEDKPRTPEYWHLNATIPDGLQTECKDCVCARRRRRLVQSRDLINAQRRAAYADDPETFRAVRREWVAANPDRAREITRDMHARRRAALQGVKVERVDHLAVFERDGWQCGICHGDIDPSLRFPDRRSASLDHVIPITRGGDHTYENTQASHLDCNNRKYNSLPGERDR